MENAIVQEIWKPIPGYESLYEASDLGRVRSVDRLIPLRASQTRDVEGHVHFYAGRILSQYLGTNGYLSVRLSRNSRTKTLLVHRVVATAFLEPQCAELQINHKDGLKTNNCPVNLEWCTGSENIFHAIAVGLIAIRRGANAGGSKLTEAIVERIRRRLELGENQRQVAARFEIGQKTVSAISSGKTWSHMPWPNSHLANHKPGRVSSC